MSKRLYFNDPIKALYMMKEFDVKFETRITGLKGEKRYFRGSCKEDLISCLDIEFDKYFYVAKESESIFKPKKGDVVSTIGGHYHDSYTRYPVSEELKGYYTGIYEDGTPSSYQGAIIVMRDSKHFFQPEIDFNQKYLPRMINVDIIPTFG